MKLTRNICCVCKEGNFSDALFDADSGMCDECSQQLHTKEALQVKYTIELKVSPFEKFIFNFSQTKIYTLKVELKGELKFLPPFKLLGEKLNFPSNIKDTNVLYKIQKALNTNTHQADILVNEALYCKLFIEDIYKVNIIHPSNISLRVGV